MVQNSAPPRKMQYLHFRLHANYFLLPGRFLKKLADDQCTFITKGSIYHIKHIIMQKYGLCRLFMVRTQDLAAYVQRVKANMQ